MLRDKYRMAPHRRLLTIIRRVSWRQSLGDKIGGVFINVMIHQRYDKNRERTEENGI